MNRRKTQTRRATRLAWLALLLTTLFLVAACGGEDAGEGGDPAAESEASTETEASREPSTGECSGEGVETAFVVHLRIPFVELITDGAEAAAADCGAELQIVGPNNFDAAAAVQAFNDVVQAGAQGATVIAIPPDLWQRVIEDALNSGTPVATSLVGGIDLGDQTPPFVAVNDAAMGRALGEVVADELGAEAEGEVVVGSCDPGLAVLDDRIKGIKEALSEKTPNLTVKGDFDTTHDVNTNFTTWDGLVQANPKAVAFIGVCAFDVPNLAKVKRSSGGDFLIAGVDLEPEALRAIEDGTALAIINGNPFLQGYIPARLVIESIASGAELPHGWIDPGVETVTKGAAADWIEREESPEKTAEFYKQRIDEIFADPEAATKPLADQRK